MSTDEATADKDNFYSNVLAERDRLAHDLHDIDNCQNRALAQLVGDNVATEFGREHHFQNIRTVADYRKAVPIRDYAALEPWLTRVAQGESNVLTAEDPLLFFMSSGTTGGNKYIPVTRSFLRQSFFPFYQAMWAPLLQHCPEILHRDDSTLNLKYDPRSAYPQTTTGKPHLGVSQVDFKKLLSAPFVEPGTRAPWSTLPVQLPDDAHHDRLYARLRIAARHDLRCLIGFNPASMSALPRQLDEWGPRLIREIHDGTINGTPMFSPDPQRARQLEHLHAQCSTLLPSHLWPRMTAIYGWNTGIASLYMEDVARLFGPNVRIFPAPLAASEGPVAIAFDRHGSAGHPTAAAALLEFVDAEEDLTPHSEACGLADLQEGKEYHVVLSHVGGFYRYAVGDVARVIEKFRGIPRLQYAGRRTLSDAAGERLRESHIIRALRRALDGTGLGVHNVSSRTQAAGTAFRYDLAIEPTSTLLPGELDTLGQIFDEALQGIAPRYAALRASGALQKAGFVVTQPKAFFREWERRVASGIRPPQVKDRMFQTDAAAWDRLTQPAAQPHA